MHIIIKEASSVQNLRILLDDIEIDWERAIDNWWIHDEIDDEKIIYLAEKCSDEKFDELLYYLYDQKTPLIEKLKEIFPEQCVRDKIYNHICKNYHMPGFWLDMLIDAKE